MTHPDSRDVRHVHNMYLPPDDRLAIATRICEGVTAGGVALGLHFVAGDFNTQVGDPRSEPEAEIAATLDATLARLQVHWTTEHVASRRGRVRTQLDGIAAPLELGALWQARARWAPDLSDHAAVVGSLSPPDTITGRRCTPGAVALLPPEAIADLRMAFNFLHLAFQVPFTVPDDSVFPAPPAVPGDPVADGPSPPRADGPEWDPLDQVPPNAALAIYGRDVMASTIKGWWRRWQRRRRHDPVATALRQLAEGTGGIPPDLTTWISAHEVLTPADGDRPGWTRLLRLYHHTTTGARGGRLPPWSPRAPGRRARPGAALRLGRRLYARDGRSRLEVTQRM